MPQRQFWTAQHPTEVVWRYQVDPRAVDKPPSLSVTVKDQSGAVMDRASVLVPFNVIHEATSGLLHCSWEAYLFGEIGDVSTTFASVIGRWRQESAARPALHLV